MTPSSYLPQIVVSVWVDGASSKVRYDAVTMYAPPRPAGEVLARGAQSVTITDAETPTVPGGAATTPTTTAATISDGSTVAELVGLVDGLPRVPYSIDAGCPPLAPGWSLVLTFAYGQGTQQIREQPSCGSPMVFFGTPGQAPPLADPRNALLNTARGLLDLPPIPASQF